MRYLINSPMVIADNMDGEIVILNMESGKYYSAMSTGAIVWQLMSNGYNVDEASKIISTYYSIVIDIVKKDLNELLTKFIEDKLIKISEVSEPIISINISDKNEYKTPEVTVYTDMEKLLLMDPIHEVENMGWPNIKKAEEKTK
jgi:hypothetical protein